VRLSRGAGAHAAAEAANPRARNCHAIQRPQNLWIPVSQYDQYVPFKQNQISFFSPQIKPGKNNEKWQQG